MLSDGSLVPLWDASTGSKLWVLTGHGALVLSVSFSPDGTTIASGSWDFTARLWNAKPPLCTRGIYCEDCLWEHSYSTFTLS